MLKTPISADSHVAEPPNCYTDFIDPKYRDTAPRIVRDAALGDVFVIDGFKKPIPIGLVAAAGKDPSELKRTGVPFEDIARVPEWADRLYRVLDELPEDMADYKGITRTREPGLKWLREFGGVRP